MKPISQKSHPLPREVMDLLSPRITNGGPTKTYATSSSPSSNGATSSSRQNVAPLKFHKSISMSSTTSHQWKASHTSTPLPPMVPTYPKVIQKNIQNLKSNIAINNAADKKDKKNVSVKPARKWLWAPFASSARNDGALFYHWVRAGVEYPDYPYARFDIHMEPLEYTNDEYDQFIDKIDSSWTKTDTDRLFHLVKIYELRWPIIHDRWLSQTDNTPKENDKDYVDMSKKSKEEKSEIISQDRSIQQLQHRYYKVTTILNRKRLQKAATIHATATTSSSPLPNQYPPNHPSSNLNHPNSSHAQKVKQVADSIVEQQAAINSLASGTSTEEPFYLDQENERRHQLELLWNRPKSEEREEIELKKELKLVEAQIRKLKKAGSHLLKQSGANTGGVGARNPVLSRSNSPVPSSNSAGLIANTNPNQFDPAFAATAPIPTAGLPYLQSARLATPATGGHMGLAKSLIQKMDATLKELQIPERPACPTKRVCDIYDTVRKKALILLSLEKITMKKEADVVGKRRKIREIQASLDLKQQHLQQQQTMQINVGNRNIKSNPMNKNKVVVVNGSQMKVSNSNKRSISMTNTSTMPMNISSMIANAPAAAAASRKTSSAKSKRRTSTSKSKQASDSSSVNTVGDGGSTTKKATKRKSKKLQQSAASIASTVMMNSKGNKAMAVMNKSKNAAMNAAIYMKQGPSTGKHASKKNMVNLPMSAATVSAVASMSMPNPVNGNAHRPIYTMSNVKTPPVANLMIPKNGPNVMKNNRPNMAPTVGMMNTNTLATIPTTNMVPGKGDTKPSKKRARKS